MLNFKVNANVEETFRKTLGSVRPTRRGKIREAIEEELFMWIWQYKTGYKIGYNQTMKKELDKLRTQQQNADNNNEEQSA